MDYFQSESIQDLLKRVMAHNNCPAWAEECGGVISRMACGSCNIFNRCSERPYEEISLVHSRRLDSPKLPLHDVQMM